MAMIYKLVAGTEWEQVRRDDGFAGTAVDVTDGFNRSREHH